MASFLARALDVPLDRAPGRFADVQVSSTHGATIGAVAEAGITLGCEGDRYCPNEAVTRGQMAAVIARARA